MSMCVVCVEVGACVCTRTHGVHVRMHVCIFIYECVVCVKQISGKYATLGIYS